MILHLYLARRWVRQFLIVGGAFLAILFLIDLVEQIRRFGGAGIGLRGTAGVAALNVAGSFYGILPLIALLAGLSLFLSMSRSSEMAAVRASGTIPEGLLGYDPSLKQQQDLGKAEALLKETGYGPGGKKLTIEPTSASTRVKPALLSRPTARISTP